MVRCLVSSCVLEVFFCSVNCPRRKVARTLLANGGKEILKGLTLEVPAGKIDKGETPLKCVRRELKEETGFKAKKIVKLVSFWPTPAFSNEVLHVYAAYGLTQSQKSPDDDEFIETSVMPFKKALEKVMNGNIKDSKTIIAILHHAVTGHHRNKPPNF